MSRAVRSLTAALSLVVLGSCSSQPAITTVPARAGIAAATDAQLTDLIEAIVTGDAKGVPNDSLFSPMGTVVANGQIRFSPPRFAGVQLGGESAVTSSQLTVREGVAWAALEYRWFNSELTQVRVGRASVIFVPRPKGGWWVEQLHSSTSR